VTEERDDAGFRALTQKISHARGVSCDAYKEKCLRRRINVRMRARGVHSFGDYSRLLDEDAHEYESLLDTLTINVTKCYRNPETWDLLTRVYLRPLWRARGGRLRVWSAGCASGEEPYTLAVVLAETARAEGPEADLTRCRIDATDVDRASLERTRAAEFAESSFSETPADLVRRYFLPGPPARPLPELQQLVHVVRHDLTREPAPHAPYDLIVCRNVVIYFDRVTQDRLFDTFVRALRPGGLLVLGKVETLFGAAREALTLENARERIYSKP
jgi:chemotaxis methyl-accepting protein methylase